MKERWSRDVVLRILVEMSSHGRAPTKKAMMARFGAGIACAIDTRHGGLGSLCRDAGLAMSTAPTTRAEDAAGVDRKGRPAAKRSRRRGGPWTPRQTWYAMISRCHDPSHHAFKNYGARGIAVCQRWRESYELFCHDIGERPSTDHTLDRIDNNGGYEPSNVRWATRLEQHSNRRDNKRISHNGKTQTTAEWAREIGISRRGLMLRIGRWGAERALTAPVPEKRRGRRAA